MEAVKLVREAQERGEVQLVRRDKDRSLANFLETVRSTARSYRRRANGSLCEAVRLYNEEKEQDSDDEFTEYIRERYPDYNI